MPTDPATERTMTDEALGELFDAAREKQDRRVAMFSYRPWCDLPPQAKANVRIFAESIAALAASRVDHELKDKRDKVMHMHDLYDALGVEWGRDPFSAIAALKAARVDTAEVMPRTARKGGLNARAEYEPDARGTFHVQAWYDTREAAQAAYSAITNGRREYPAPAPRECRKHEGDFFGVPLYSDPNCPTDRVVFEYDGKAVACALIHPDSTALRRNAAEVGQ